MSPSPAGLAVPVETVMTRRTYGFSESRRAPLALPRLRAVPATRFGLGCQEVGEVAP
jgi:hypothetical protein